MENIMPTQEEDGATGTKRAEEVLQAPNMAYS